MGRKKLSKVKFESGLLPLNKSEKKLILKNTLTQNTTMSENVNTEHFTKELNMTKKLNVSFNKSTRVYIDANYNTNYHSTIKVMDEKSADSSYTSKPSDPRLAIKDILGKNEFQDISPDDTISPLVQKTKEIMARQRQRSITNEVNYFDNGKENLINTSKTIIEKSSCYSDTAHSGVYIGEDVYISDMEGSSVVDVNSDGEIIDNDESKIDIILTGSKMGLMRRGLPSTIDHSHSWVRPNDINNDEKKQLINNETDKRSKEQKLQDMTPSERAAYLLSEKKRKLEEAKDNIRILESSENAGRDPCLFSKRTAFDIRMDQIEDKPWVNANLSVSVGDITDYFNYGLTEEDWMEYAEKQLIIRQELTDAYRQKRLPDPTTVPVIPRTPRKQNPRVAVAVRKGDFTTNENEKEETSSDDKMELGLMNEDDIVFGPRLPDSINHYHIIPSKNIYDKVIDDGENNKTLKKGIDLKLPKSSESCVINDKINSSKNILDPILGDGGAWGINPTPGSTLMKIIEDQQWMQKSSSQGFNEKKDLGNKLKQPPPPPIPLPIPPPPPSMLSNVSTFDPNVAARNIGAINDKRRFGSSISFEDSFKPIDYNIFEKNQYGKRQKINHNWDKTLNESSTYIYNRYVNNYGPEGTGEWEIQNRYNSRSSERGGRGFDNQFQHERFHSTHGRGYRIRHWDRGRVGRLY